MAYARACHGICHGTSWHVPWHAMAYGIAGQGICHGMPWHMAYAMACCGIDCGVPWHIPWHAMAYVTACHGLCNGMPWPMPCHSMAYARPYHGICHGMSLHMLWQAPWHMHGIRLLASWVDSKSLSKLDGKFLPNVHTFMTDFLVRLWLGNAAILELTVVLVHSCQVPVSYCLFFRSA